MVAVGDVFAVEVDGEYGLCRVVAAEKPRGAWDKHGRWRVVTCEWVGPRKEVAAALKREEAMAPLKLHRLKGKLHVQSIGRPPPASFELVGVYPPRDSEKRLHSPRNPGAWEWIPLQLKGELEYRADPAESKAKWSQAVRAQRVARAAALKESRRNKKARPRTLGARDGKVLTSLGNTKFGEWRGHPRGFVSAVREEVKLLSSALRSAKTVSAVVTELKKTLAGLNQLEAKHHVVMTPDAEELVEVLVGLAVASGLEEGFAAQTVDELRDF